MADKTLDMTLQFIKAVLSFSFVKGYSQQDIAPQIVPMSKAKLLQKAVRGFTNDELKLIFSADGLDPNILVCFLGLLHLGVRRGELAQITWNNVDMKGRSIRVYGEKTNKWRTIPISSALLPHLEKAYTEHGKRNHVFCRESGDVADKHLYRTLMRICKEVGIDTSDITVHSFRHTFIQRHLQAGVNFKTIMSWSGHSDIKTFMVYLNQYQPVPEDINKADYAFLSDPADLS
jgi:ATP-dependent helicase/nuclease subunit A